MVRDVKYQQSDLQEVEWFSEGRVQLSPSCEQIIDRRPDWLTSVMLYSLVSSLATALSLVSSSMLWATEIALCVSICTCATSSFSSASVSRSIVSCRLPTVGDCERALLAARDRYSRRRGRFRPSLCVTISHECLQAALMAYSSLSFSAK